MNPSDDKYRGLRRLPPFPAVATKLLRLLSNDDVAVREIVSLIRADPALASELMRVVNSPLYGFPARISSIQNAVTLLGLQTVRSFALTVSMKGFLHTALRLDLLRRIWRHSLACGILCDDISAACSASQGSDDRAYTAGLLHNVGRLGLFVAHPRAYAEMLAQPFEGDILERERETFGLDHCEAGAWLARSWGLPQELEIVIARHHQPPTPAFDLADLVRVAVLLSDLLGFDVLPPAHPYTLTEIRSMMPAAAQYRFHPDQDALTARLTGRLDTFD
ncbi:MAG TPA: HDOD domain-containing protein [Bryobacteraceae bacterium]|nr:HDOD domain-containing protein [Bryobacteraceae bacterium]